MANPRSKSLVFTMNKTQLEFELGKKLGRGAFGAVYEALPVGATKELLAEEKVKKPLKRMLMPAHGFVIKKIERDEFDLSEVQTLLEIYPQTAAPITAEEVDEEYCYILTERLPGQSLIDAKANRYIPHPKLIELNFHERIQLIQQIVEQLNLTHQHTMAKDSKIHRDITGQNIMVDIASTANGHSIKSGIIDFGFTIAANVHQPEEKITPEDDAGSRDYMAPEAFLGHVSTKSDVYSLAPVIAVVLGANNPILPRENIYKQVGADDRKLVKRLRHGEGLYDFSDILGGVDLPALHIQCDLKKIMADFLNRMQAFDPTKRPSAYEVLRFFTVLNQLALADQPTRAEENSLLAQLILLANGYWNRQDKGVENINFEQYDFGILKQHRHRIGDVDLEPMMAKFIENMEFVSYQTITQFFTTLAQLFQSINTSGNKGEAQPELVAKLKQLVEEHQHQAEDEKLPNEADFLIDISYLIKTTPLKIKHFLQQKANLDTQYLQHLGVYLRNHFHQAQQDTRYEKLIKIVSEQLQDQIETALSSAREWPRYVCDIKIGEIFTKFQDNSLMTIPNDETVLHFLTTCNQLLGLTPLPHTAEQEYEVMAKLITLANGTWSRENIIGPVAAEEITKNYTFAAEQQFEPFKGGLEDRKAYTAKVNKKYYEVHPVSNQADVQIDLHYFLNPEEKPDNPSEYLATKNETDPYYIKNMSYFLLEHSGVFKPDKRLQILKQTLTTFLLADIIQYKTKADQAIAAQGDKKLYRGKGLFKKLGYSAQEKSQAAGLLIGVFKGELSIDDFFAKENAKLISALKRGELGRLSKEFVNFLEKNKGKKSEVDEAYTFKGKMDH